MKKIPLHSLVLFISNPRTGLAQHYFQNYEILSIESIIFSIVGEYNRYDVNSYAYNLLLYMVETKIKAGERVVIEGSLFRKEDRLTFTNIAESLGIPIYYMVKNSSVTATDRYSSNFMNNMRDILSGDNIATVINLDIETNIDIIKKISGYNIQEYIENKGFRGITAVGDVHGMLENIKIVYDWAVARNTFILFLGDYIDYGSKSIECVEYIYDLVVRGRAGCVIGNHERKILKWFDQTKNNNYRIQLSPANKTTIDKITAMHDREKNKFECKFRSLLNLSKNHWCISNVVFTHGAVDPQMFNIHSSRLNGKLETYALYGEVDTIEKNRPDGYPNRVYNWVSEIPNGCIAIVGHDIRNTSMPLIEKNKQGGTVIFLDTGSGKGGKLSTCDLKFQNSKLYIQNYNVI
jgi:hypothetical protein